MLFIVFLFFYPLSSTCHDKSARPRQRPKIEHASITNQQGFLYLLLNSFDSAAKLRTHKKKPFITFFLPANIKLCLYLFFFMLSNRKFRFMGGDSSSRRNVKIPKSAICETNDAMFFDI